MPNFDPKIHHRRSIRLKEYDYSQTGAYFVTIVAWQREMLFGEIVNGEMDLNPFGQIVLNAWMDLPNHYRHAELSAFVIMSNHVHGIMLLNDGGWEPLHNGRGGSPVSGKTNLSDGLIAGTEPLPTNQTRPYVTVKLRDRQTPRSA